MTPLDPVRHPEAGRLFSPVPLLRREGVGEGVLLRGVAGPLVSFLGLVL